MRALNIISIEIYQQLSIKYSNLTERREATKQYILNEITQWNVKELIQGENYFYKPEGFEGTEDSTPFSARLVYDPGFKIHELKFGNLNAPTDKEKFKWEDNDPYRLQKALFLQNVLNKYVLPLILNKKVNGVLFSPYDGDDLKEDRLSYFYNMFSKVGKEKLNWKQIGDKYYITKK
jgi:hypothetical protein